MKKINLLFFAFLFSNILLSQTVFINEIHYDNDGVDTGEAIEIAGPAGTSLSGWTLVLYNGATGAVYDTIILTNFFPNQDDGYGTLSFPTIGIENGAPDGMALVDASNNVIQFLSYEGTFTATSGPAIGMTSEDIGVFETGNTPVGFSLQLMGTGIEYTHFNWGSQTPHTTNAVNNNQNFGAPVNDLCTNATSLTCGDFFSVSTVEASNTFPVANNCGFAIGDGVWYTFSSPVRGRFFIQGSNNIGGFPYLDIYEGDCTSLSCVGAMGGTPNTSIALIPNQDYYLYFHESNGTQPIDLDISVTCGPWAICVPNPVFILDANGEVNITPQDMDNGSDSPNGIQSMSLNRTSFNCSDVGFGQIVELTVIDNMGMVDTCTTQVFIVDDSDPTLVTQNITVPLDVNGTATIAPEDLDNGTTDNCSFTLSVSPSSFNCNDIGVNTVSVMAVDPSGNDSSSTALVTIVDDLPPVVLTQDITVNLDNNGQVTITVNDIDNGSTDNCGITTLSLDTTSFNCTNLGTNTVTLTAIDDSSNVASQTAIVTVVDAIAPDVVVQDVTLTLDSNGEAFLATGDVNVGTTDNCGTFTEVLSQDTFTCADIGANTITYTATDSSGNSASETIIITVLDLDAPTVMLQDVTLSLDTNGEVTLLVADIDNGSLDNCGIDTEILSQELFSCGDIGDNSVTYTATDTSGNSASGTVIISIIDDLAPNVEGQDITVDLLGNPSVSIIPEDVDNGSTDNCDLSLSLDLDTFSAPGTYTVELTGTDSSSNTASVTVTVTVVDTLSISSFELGENLKLYPVPASEYIYLNTHLIVNEVLVFDFSGKKLLSSKVVDNQFSIENLPSGVYLAQFTTDTGILIKRIIKE